MRESQTPSRSACQLYRLHRCPTEFERYITLLAPYLRSIGGTGERACSTLSPARAWPSGLPRPGGPTHDGPPPAPLLPPPLRADAGCGCGVRIGICRIHMGQAHGHAYGKCISPRAAPFGYAHVARGAHTGNAYRHAHTCSCDGAGTTSEGRKDKGDKAQSKSRSHARAAPPPPRRWSDTVRCRRLRARGRRRRGRLLSRRAPTITIYIGRGPGVEAARHAPRG